MAKRLRLDKTRPEMTGGQLPGMAYGMGVGAVSYEQALTSPLPESYDTYRELRKDPTLALARALSVAPILASSWSVEGDDPEMVQFIQDEVLPIRELIVEPALYGGIDFGWQGYEEVFAERGGRVVLKKAKPLLQDITTVMVDAKTGAFMGYRQGVLSLPLNKCLHVGFRVEGTQWHGQSLLENARVAVAQWTKANESAARFDKKIAGSHWVVYYPPGTSRLNGVDTPNDQIAASLLRSLEASGCISIPSTIAKYVEDLESQSLAWKIELLTARGEGGFTDRLRYLDVLKVRAILCPERMALEASFGTRADAGVHADLAVTVRELEHKHLTRIVNWHLVDRLLALNWGPKARGRAWLSPEPLTDEAVGYLRSVYAALLANPQGFQREFPNISAESLRDRLQVPTDESPTPLEPQAGPPGEFRMEFKQGGGPPRLALSDGGRVPPGITPEEARAVEAAFGSPFDLAAAFDPGQARDDWGRWTGGLGVAPRLKGRKLRMRIRETTKQIREDWGIEDHTSRKFYKRYLRAFPQSSAEDAAMALDNTTSYFHGYSEEMNFALRRGKRLRMSGLDIRAAARGLSLMPRNDRGSTVYRGMALKEQDARRFREGRVVRDRGFMSTSASRRVAADFAEPEKRRVRVLLELRDKRGLGRKVPRALTEFWTEREVVFPPRSRVKIREVREVKGVLRVRGDVL